MFLSLPPPPPPFSPSSSPLPCLYFSGHFVFYSPFPSPSSSLSSSEGRGRRPPVAPGWDCGHTTTADKISCSGSPDQKARVGAAHVCVWWGGRRLWLSLADADGGGGEGEWSCSRSRSLHGRCSLVFPSISHPTGSKRDGENF